MKDIWPTVRRWGTDGIKKGKYPLLILLLGVILLCWGRGKESQAPPGEESEPPEQESFSLTAFEEQLGMTIANIEGAGRVQVVLTLKSTGESIYASDVSRSGSGEQRSDYKSNLTILNDRSSGESPVLVKTYYPEFRGALVVCDGADQPAVQQRIVEAVQAVCGLESADISVVKMRT